MFFIQGLDFRRRAEGGEGDKQDEVLELVSSSSLYLGQTQAIVKVEQ